MTDRAIINKIMESGRVDLYEEIVRRYSGEVYAAALATSHNPAIAEEATQQAFVKAYENIERWRGGVSIAPYLKMIAHNTTLSLIEEQKRHRGVLAESVQIASEEFSLAHEELLSDLGSAIAKLPELERTIIELFYWEGKRATDIATLTGLSESNVLVRLHRIRNKLKTMIHYGE